MGQGPSRLFGILVGLAGAALTGCAVIGSQPWWPGGRVAGTVVVENAHPGAPIGPLMVYLEADRDVPEGLAPAREIRARHDGRGFQPRLALLGRG